MKSKLFSKVRIISIAMILFSFLLVTGFAKVTNTTGCPAETGGYAHTGSRSTEVCNRTVTTEGYFWHIEGKVKWVGAIIANVGGYFEKGKDIKTYQGTEYKCNGMNYDLCWVCNCYYQPIMTVEN